MCNLSGQLANLQNTSNHFFIPPQTQCMAIVTTLMAVSARLATLAPSVTKTTMSVVTKLPVRMEQSAATSDPMTTNVNVQRDIQILIARQKLMNVSQRTHVKMEVFVG